MAATERKARGAHYPRSLAEAEAHYQSALLASPDNADTLYRLGMLLHRAGRHREAVPLLRRALEVRPDIADYHWKLAGVLGTLGEHEQAIEHLRRALAINEKIPQVHHNLGVAFEHLGRLDEAVDCHREALRLDPNYAQALNHLGNVLRKLGRIRDAADCHRRAIALRPNYAEAYNNLATALAEQADQEGAIQCLRRTVELSPADPAGRGGLLYSLHYSPAYDAEALFREHREWGRLFCEPLRDQSEPHRNDRDPERKLRVGYVSPDLREHTVTKFIRSAIEDHDREKFELFCYSDAEKPDAVTQRLRRLVQNWHETRKLKDVELEALIRQHRIDILVDLRGHAAANRLTLFARKPAPVQVSMVGYFNTTGLATMDYRITDERQDPPGMTERYHTEQLVRLPHSCWCYSADEDAPEVADPPALKNGYVTFGSLNKIVKVNEPCAKLWARVMQEVPGSRLMLSVAEHVAQSPSTVLERSSKETVPMTSAFGGTQPRAAVPQHYPVQDRLSQLGLPSDRVDLLGKTATGGSTWNALTRSTSH